jgi:hypothetical protein
MDTKRANMAFQGLKKQYLMSSEPRQEGETQEEFDHRMERKSLKETGIDRDITQIISEDLNTVKTLNLGAFITKLLKKINFDSSEYNIKDNFVPYDLKLHFHNEKGFHKAYVSGLPKIFYEITSGLPKMYYKKTIGRIPDKIEIKPKTNNVGYYGFRFPDKKTDDTKAFNLKDIDMDDYKVSKVFIVDGFFLEFSFEYDRGSRSIEVYFRLYHEEGTLYPKNYIEIDLDMHWIYGLEGDIIIKGFDELFSKLGYMKF